MPTSSSVLSRSALRTFGLAAVFASAACLPAAAQQSAKIAELTLPAAPLAATPAQPLPDAPSSSSLASLPSPANSLSFAADPVTTHASQPMAGVYDTVIQPGQAAPRLSATNEFVASLKSSISPTAVLGWLVSSGYSQLADSSPNFENGGVGRQYGQRLGAAAARSTSETIFGNGIIAPLVHQDPRYYRMGPGHSVIKRGAYAITRPLITRTNSGKTTLNLWDLGGDLSGAALTPVYYPPLNTSFTEVMKTFGGSVGGDAIGFAVSEFLPDILHGLHLRRAQ